MCCFQGKRAQFFPRMGSAVSYSVSVGNRVCLDFQAELFWSSCPKQFHWRLEPVICSPSEIPPGLDERKLVPDERGLTATQKAELILFHVVSQLSELELVKEQKLHKSLEKGLERTS